ncbi:MAG: class I SAM-dependent methyltransferase [Nitrospirota bacterium]
MNNMLYPTRSPLVQFFCPAPKRHVQDLIKKLRLGTGLDIGCGRGSLLSSLRCADFISTGLDANYQNITESRENDVHDNYIHGDLKSLTINDRFDVVIMSHVIEHFTREEGHEVIRNIERIAKHLIYIETPNGFFEIKADENNHYDRHLSGWFPHDFAGRGYTVYGSGPLWMNKYSSGLGIAGGLLRRAVSRATQRYYFKRPIKAATIAAIRYKDDIGNICGI